MSSSSALAFSEPRDYRGVFFIQKASRHMCRGADRRNRRQGSFFPHGDPLYKLRDRRKPFLAVRRLVQKFVARPFDQMHGNVLHADPLIIFCQPLYAPAHISHGVVFARYEQNGQICGRIFILSSLSLF